MPGEFLCGGAALGEVTLGEFKGVAIPVIRYTQKGEGMGMVLRQSTAVTVLLGPFLDDYDGVTAETALTISQADVRLSKNGAASAQKNEASAATHDANGYYTCPLDATDTNTVGFMDIFVSETGALPVRMTVQIIEEAVYDDLYVAAATGVPTATEVRTEMDSNSTKLGDILTDTGTTLPATLTTIEGKVDTVDTVVDAILVDTGTDIPGTITTLTSKVDVVDGIVDTIVVDTSTDLPASIAALQTTANTIETTTTTTIPNLITTVDTVVDAILMDTGTDLPALITTVDTVVDRIEVDTQDIQSRLPAALAGGLLQVDVIAISGSTTAADNLEESTEAIVTGTATGTPTTTTMAASALTEATDDHYNGRVIIWKSGAANGIAAVITSYNGTTKTFTFPATVTAATAGDLFIIV